MMLPILLCLVHIATITGAPADTPVKVDLPVVDPPEPQTSESRDSDIGESRAVPPSNTGSKAGLISNIISNKLQLATNAVNSKVAAEKDVFVNPPFYNPIKEVGIFGSPPVKLESAVLQTEGFESKPLSVKENIQSVVTGFFQPKPIVDTITEDEKYGNNGEKFATISRAIVGGAEGFSNLVNTALEVPSNIIKKITRAASEKLNNLGAKLIGLQ